jgi:hypothetical protein
MASIPGAIPVTGFIGPTDSSDTYAVTDAIYGVDGYRSVSATTARNAITYERRREGMLVYTQADQNVWQLLTGPWSFTDSDWKLFISSGVTGMLSGGSGNFLSVTGGTMYGNITMSSQTKIMSSNGGGQIDLDIWGSPGEIMISTDNAAYTGGYLNLADNYVDLYGGISGTLGVTRGVQSGAMNYGGLVGDWNSQNHHMRIFQATPNFTNGSQGAMGLSILGSGSTSPNALVRGINIKDVTTYQLITKNYSNPAIIIGSQNSRFNTGVTNSVIIGGVTLTADTSNTMFAQNARLAENGGVIYSAGTDLYSIFQMAGSGGYAETLITPSAGAVNTITHNLGTTDITVALWLVTTGDLTQARVTNRTTTTVDIIFTVAPSENVRVVIK